MAVLFLSGLSLPDQALPVAREAVATYRELAASSPDRYRSDLADCLWCVAGILKELGHAADAEQAAKEACQLSDQEGS
jgi:hypothetical protein